MERDTCLCDNLECSLENETLALRVDDEDDDEDFDDDPNLIGIVGSTKRNELISCVRSNPCTVCLYVLTVLLLLASVVSIVVIVIVVVKPYHKVSGFARALCSPVHTIKDFTDIWCSCGKGCSSQFHCFRITVRILPEDDVLDSRLSRTPWLAVLADDESTLHRQCTFYPDCQTSLEQNQASVRQYVYEYGDPRHNYTCFYNPSDKSDVIRSSQFSAYHVVHGLLWPLLACGFSSASLVLMFKHRGCQFL